MESQHEHCFEPVDPGTVAADIGARVNELIATYIRSRHSRPITDPTPVEELRGLFDEPMPRAGMPHEALLDDFADRVMSHTTASTSPGYFGLMNPTPMLIGIYADALASAINQNQGASHHSPAGCAMEETVISWLGDATGYGADCHGHLTSGGTVANLTALKMALHRAAPEVRDRGLVGAGRRLAVYTSDQAHFSIDRAMDVLGLGQSALRKIPARSDAVADVAGIAAAIAADRKDGWEPLAIVAMAGSTAAGAIDPIDELAGLAAEEGTWLHVDAAYGGAVGLSRRYPGLMKGIERADSVTVDAHKWFFVPFVAGGILHKDPDHELASFQLHAAYIPPPGGTARPPTDYYQRGVAGTRRFNALKVWMTFKHVGADWYADVVDRQMNLSRRVAQRVSELDGWAVATPPATAIVTFRFEPLELSGAIAKGGAAAKSAMARRDTLQDWIADTVREEGRFWISVAPLPTGPGLRLNVISYLTDEATIDAFLDTLPELGRRAEEAVS